MMIIKNDNNNNNNMNTKTTKTKYTLLIFYITSSILMLAFSIFSVQLSLAQVSENNTNSVPITNLNKKSETITSFTAESKKPMHVPNQIVVVAEDIEEIRDNLEEAREALNNANYLQVLSHIDNIDQLLTAFVVSESSTDEINKNSTLTNNTIAAANGSTEVVPSSTDSMLNENNKLITIKGGNGELKINEQLFAPNNLTISKGTSVIWLNKDDLPHTITLKKLDGQQTQEFKFALSLGDSYKYTFDEAGIYGFYSDRSKWSEGKITVS